MWQRNSLYYDNIGLPNNTRKIALYPSVKGNDLTFTLVGDSKPIPKTFDPSIGTISRAIIQCPFCNHIIDATTTRNLFQNKKSGRRLIAIVYQDKQKRRKQYRLPNKNDLESFEKSKNI